MVTINFVIRSSTTVLILSIHFTMDNWHIDYDSGKWRLKTVLMIGDSHCRDLAIYMNDEDPSTHYICLFRPGAQLRHLQCFIRFGLDLDSYGIKRVDQIVMHIGGNDLVTKDGTPRYERVGSKAATFVKYVNEAAALLTRRLDVRRLTVSLPHPRYLGGTKNSTHRWLCSTVRYIGRRLKASAEIVSNRHLFMRGQRVVLREYFEKDGVHLTKEGKKKWARSLIRQLKD